jgi:hypothetical protein
VDAGHFIAYRDDLGQPLVTDRVAWGQRQPAVTDRDVQVTTGHHQRPNQSLSGRGHYRLGRFAPRVFPGLFEHQLPHLSIVE